MTERFWIAPLKPPLPNAVACELCGKNEVNLYIQDMAPEHNEHIHFVHDTCLAAYCEFNHVRPPDSFVTYCIDKLGLRVEKKGQQ